MKLSTRSTYGLSAMLNLAMHYGQGAMSVSQIAREESISVAYLEQIFYRLKKRHWIKSVRGPSGGYMLAKAPGEVNVGDVLRALEGKRLDYNPKRDRKTSRTQKSGLASNLFWDRLSHQIKDYIDTSTLKTLIDEAAKQSASDPNSPQFNFNI